MELAYDGTLVMPKNFVEVTEEEMTYLDGGATYKGKDALRELTCMAACAFGWSISTAKLGKVLASGAVASLTGIGLVVAIAAALGFGAALSLATMNAVCFALACAYYIKDKGFKAKSFSVFHVTTYYSVSRL